MCFLLPAGLKSRFYGLDDEQCSVEELALQYYASEEGGGWRGVHRQALLVAGHARLLAFAWQSPFRGFLASIYSCLRCMCSEGGIWATLFGLLMWDVLFMHVPDVFRTPFQVRPHCKYSNGSCLSALPAQLD